MAMDILKKFKTRNVRIYEPVKITGLKNIQFGKNIIIDCFSYIYADKQMIIGDNTHIGSFTFICGGDVIEIGDFVGIGQGVKIYASTEDLRGWGFGNPTVADRHRNTLRAPVHINKFAVIGANSVILPGVTIGEGAAVGACSVITRDLDPWGIYIGNKKVGERMKKEVLENYKEFLKSIETI